MNDYMCAKQELAAVTLSQGQSVKDTAQIVGIGLSTLYRWRTEQAFNDRVIELMNDQEAEAIRTIYSLKPTASEHLKDMLESKDMRIKAKAVEMILKF